MPIGRIAFSRPYVGIINSPRYGTSERILNLNASIAGINEGRVCRTGICWLTWAWRGLAEYTEPAPEPHVPHQLLGFVVLLLFSYLSLPLLFLYVFAQLAHFRQRKTKGDCAYPKKKTAKRKGPAVDAPVQEESPVATEDGGLLGRGGDVCRDTSCSDTPDGAGAAQVGVLSAVL